MRKFRINNDVPVIWRIVEKQTLMPFDLEGKTVKVALQNRFGIVPIEEFDVSGNVISFIFKAAQQGWLGVYTATAAITDAEGHTWTMDACQILELVSRSCCADVCGSHGVDETSGVEFSQIIVADHALHYHIEADKAMLIETGDDWLHNSKVLDWLFRNGVGGVSKEEASGIGAIIIVSPDETLSQSNCANTIVSEDEGVHITFNFSAIIGHISSTGYVSYFRRFGEKTWNKVELGIVKTEFQTVEDNPVERGTGNWSLMQRAEHHDGPNVASGECAVALGHSNEATEHASYAEGYNNVSGGWASHVEGVENVAGPNAHFSHVGGNMSRADHEGAFVHGRGLRSAVPGQAVVGKWNALGSSAFAVGNGTSDNERKNIFQVDEDGTLWTKDPITGEIRRLEDFANQPPLVLSFGYTEADITVEDNSAYYTLRDDPAANNDEVYNYLLSKDSYSISPCIIKFGVIVPAEESGLGQDMVMPEYTILTTVMAAAYTEEGVSYKMIFANGYTNFEGFNVVVNLNMSEVEGERQYSVFAYMTGTEDAPLIAHIQVEQFLDENHRLNLRVGRVYDYTQDAKIWAISMSEFPYAQTSTTLHLPSRRVVIRNDQGSIKFDLNVSNESVEISNPYIDITNNIVEIPAIKVSNAAYSISGVIFDFNKTFDAGSNNFLLKRVVDLGDGSFQEEKYITVETVKSSYVGDYQNRVIEYKVGSNCFRVGENLAYSKGSIRVDWKTGEVIGSVEVCPIASNIETFLSENAPIFKKHYKYSIGSPEATTPHIEIDFPNSDMFEGLTPVVVFMVKRKIRRVRYKKGDSKYHVYRKNAGFVEYRAFQYGQNILPGLTYEGNLGWRAYRVGEEVSFSELQMLIDKWSNQNVSDGERKVVKHRHLTYGFALRILNPKWTGDKKITPGQTTRSNAVVGTVPKYLYSRVVEFKLSGKSCFW